MERYPSIPTVMMDWSPFDGEGDSDLIQDNSLLGRLICYPIPYIDKAIYPNSLVLPARWTKRQRVCGWKGIGRR